LDLTAAIDGSGRYHVATVCDGGIRYLTSSDGVAWRETSLVPPVDRFEVDPQLALDGDTVYLADSLLAPTEGGCGDDGLQDVGVYTRFLKPPRTEWSTPVRVGAVGDRVQSFRVVDGVRHLTVTANDGGGPLFYESQSGPTLTRSPIPNAVTTSLRVGDDGHARIAYSTGHAIRYARVAGGQLSTATVASSTKTNLMAPSLVLGPGDRAYVTWIQDRDGGGGCAGIEAGPLDGIYFGTNAGGTWKTTRLVRTPGQVSLTLDPSRRIEVVTAGGSGMTAMVSVDGSSWTSTKLPGTATLINPLIRVNPQTGGAIIFAVDLDKGIYLLTGP